MIKFKFLALITFAVLITNAVSFAAPVRRSKAQSSKLVSLLPASDGVVIFDGKRFLNDALPKILSANQPALTEVMAKLTEMQTRTGIDFRKFDQVAVGVAIKQVSPKEVDYEPLAIASGEVNAGALIAIAKLASNGTYRQEKIGDKSVYVFSVKDVANKNATKVVSSKIAGYVDDALSGISKDAAVTAIDENTLAIGSLARIRETLEKKSHVSADITSLLSSKTTAVASFALRSPGGLSKMLPLENDELGLNVDAIQYLYGSLDVSGLGTTLQITGRTKNAEQAKSLAETIEGLKTIGTVLLGAAKGADKQVYSRMLKSVQFAQAGTEVSLNLMVPQADIDILIGGIK